VVAAELGVGNTRRRTRRSRPRTPPPAGRHSSGGPEENSGRESACLGLSWSQMQSTEDTPHRGGPSEIPKRKSARPPSLPRSSDKAALVHCFSRRCGANFAAVRHRAIAGRPLGVSAQPAAPTKPAGTGGPSSRSCESAAGTKGAVSLFTFAQPRETRNATSSSQRSWWGYGPL